MSTEKPSCEVCKNKSICHVFIKLRELTIAMIKCSISSSIPTNFGSELCAEICSRYSSFKIVDGTIEARQSFLHSQGFLLECYITGTDSDYYYEAVRRFQRHYGLLPDGLWGPSTKEIARCQGYTYE